MDITDDNIKNYVEVYLNESILKTNDGEHLSSMPPIGEWDVSKVTNMSRLFEGQALFKDQLSNWDVSNVTDMSYMFKGCSLFDSSLKWDVSNVTNMSHMFEDCKQFKKTLDWEMRKVTDMSYMFKGCTSLRTIGKNGIRDGLFNVLSVTDMSYMFKGCTELREIGWMSNWEVSKVTNMSHMFEDCSHLFDLRDLYNWDVSSVTDMSYMFNNCRWLTYLGISVRMSYPDGTIRPISWNVLNVNNMSHMFTGCEDLKIDLSGLDMDPDNIKQYDNFSDNPNIIPPNFTERILQNHNIRKYVKHYFNGHNRIPIGTWDVTNITNMNSLFANIEFNENLSDWDVSNVTDMSDMFRRCTIFNNGGKPLVWNVSKVTTMSEMFKDCQEFNQPLVWDGGNWDVSNVTDMASMFSGCIIFNNGGNPLNWNVSKVEDMIGMFKDCGEFNQPLVWDGVNWDVSNVIDMRCMFFGCTIFNNGGKPLNWNVSKVTTMYCMFYECKEFNQPLVWDGGNWDVSNVTNMESMFFGCTIFNNGGNPLNWNVSKVTTMYEMFSECNTFNQPLVWGDEPWDVSRVTDMMFMFKGCTIFNQPLKWKVSNVTDMASMFSGCKSFKQDLTKWNISRVDDHDDMFKDCPCPVRYQPHFVNAYEVHQKASRINFVELIKILKRDDIPDSFKGNPFGDIENMILAISDNVSADKDKVTRILDRIRHVELTPITIVIEAVYHSLHYVLTKPIPFQKLYIEALIYDCITSYNGAENEYTLSCPFGILERCVFSLLAPCHVEENPEYFAITQAIVPPLPPISDSILAWYKSHKGMKGFEHIDLTEDASGKLKENLYDYLHELGYSKDDIDSTDTMELGFDKDTFTYGGRKSKRGHKKTRSKRKSYHKKTRLYRL